MTPPILMNSMILSPKSKTILNKTPLSFLSMAPGVLLLCQNSPENFISYSILLIKRSKNLPIPYILIHMHYLHFNYTRIAFITDNGSKDKNME